ncbi:MAG: diguanylate cyclase/phosphodiesterase [Frankiales bacterium]|nr:diguanylate cyclase/phosphodiesterase [Frankiales bacterium]
MTPSRTRGGRCAAVVLLLAALSAASLEGADGLAVGGQTATAVVMAAFLVSGTRRQGPLWRAQLLMLLAMASGLAAALVRLGWQLTTDDLPSSVWVTNALALLWLPLVVGALLAIPVAESRQGFRARALADGLLAASSLWYLLLGVGVARALDASHVAAAHRVHLLLTPIGDVFVVATALAVYARCQPAYRRLVAWSLAGLMTIACSDLLFAIPENGRLAGPSSPAGLVNQAGMLMLVLAAASMRRDAVVPDSPAAVRSFGVAGALPFLPLLGCVVVTSRMILQGSDMPLAQLLPALCVALALMGRQLTGSRDKERLVQALRTRERDLESELRLDLLTGLGNRKHLAEALSAALSDPAQHPVSVALLDLNDFKLINDNHGHETGDAVLVEVAARLRRVVRGEDAVSRLGGDEFAVVASGVTDGGLSLAERLLSAFDEPVRVGSQSFGVRSSIGLVNGQEGESAAVALACADVAMYEAKAQRGSVSTVSVLTAEGRARAARRLRVQEAVSDPKLEQFSLVYQPVVELATGRVRGMEALLRWEHPDLGPVPPDVFVPHAERAGTIGLLGDFVLATALRDLAELQGLTPERIAVGVNVSPAQLLDDRLVRDAVELVRAHGLEPDQLNIEVTEHAFESDLGAVAATIDALTAAGMSVAVDDFGTGYSSLQYLQRLPVDVMKIDRSFVWEAVTSPRARLLLTSIVSMASVLDLQLVGEGIETHEQLAALREMGCELGQGYLFSRPVPLEQMRALVLAGARIDLEAPTTVLPPPRRPADVQVAS